MNKKNLIHLLSPDGTESWIDPSTVPGHFAVNTNWSALSKHLPEPAQNQCSPTSEVLVYVSHLNNIKPRNFKQRNNMKTKYTTVTMQSQLNAHTLPNNTRKPRKLEAIQFLLQYWPWRSKVDDFNNIWKSVCDFLLLTNSNLTVFWDTV